VLRGYWEASEIINLSAPRADSFGSRRLGDLPCYGETFVRDPQ
jgi:hypothetical protein